MSRHPVPVGKNAYRSRDIFPTKIGRWLGLEHVMLKLKCERPAKWMEDEMAQSEVSPTLLTVSQMEQGAELLARVFQHDPIR
jgi:hypothetical protein